MRERMSRGKRTDNDEGEFVYGIPVEGEPLLGMGKRTYIITKPGVQWVDGVYMTYDECIEVDPKTIGDYTGLTDRNNKMIFEGDIVKHYIKNPEIVKIYIVEWKNRLSKFVGRYKGDEYYGKKYAYAELHEQLIYEVIGNIYDNPELLEVKQNG